MFFIKNNNYFVDAKTINPGIKIYNHLLEKEEISDEDKCIKITFPNKYEMLCTLKEIEDNFIISEREKERLLDKRLDGISIRPKKDNSVFAGEISKENQIILLDNGNIIMAYKDDLILSSKNGFSKVVRKNMINTLFKELKE